MKFQRIAQLRSPAAFRTYLQQSGIELDFDERLQSGPDSPLARAYLLPGGFKIGNRFCVLPMEGWDGTTDGKPTSLTFRRWRRFGASGAKLIWGGEAVAVNPEGRANPNQLVASQANLEGLVALRQHLLAAHAEAWSTDDLWIGLQLTHSGRFCRPNDKVRLEPRILYDHPLLNRKFHIAPNTAILSDADIQRLIDDTIRAAQLAQRAGFDFVDIKHCHGYLGHEFLSAVDRPGLYGGSFENRTRYLREIVQGIRSEAPGLQIGVRLSAIDFIPFQPGPDGVGLPERYQGVYPYAFGGDGSGLGIDLSEPQRFLDLLETLEVRLVCISAGSAYYNPHLLRPAIFPPSDGYQPPEDPLAGVARQIQVTAQLKAAHPGLLFVGSGYSYLQEWLPNVAQYNIRAGKTDFAGLGRMILAYPELCADVLAGRPLQRKRICRTFSDCTSAPRNGLVSGCYPLDPFYKERPEADELRKLKS
jgi:2,4-dienoyl-CoA reductase-like NADH-dependent reductase (Old Yellow Enzyme family)